MDGILNVNKPAGITSHDVVLKIRKILKHEKVGHCGTLDPHATGVLLVCVGRATKLSQYFLTLDKTYWAQCTLGKTTDSQDADGQVLEEKPVPEINKVQIEETLQLFLGEIEQIPPMVSAKRVQGQRLYKLARKGVEVERAPVKVHIKEIELLAWESPVITFKVKVSSGTYVRTLCEDIGKKLGCGAYLNALDRMSVGNFHVDKSRDLESLINREKIASKLHGLPQLMLEYKIDSLGRSLDKSATNQSTPSEADMSDEDVNISDDDSKNPD